MKLDNRYRLHQALRQGVLGLFGPVITFYRLHKGMNLYQAGLFFTAY